MWAAVEVVCGAAGCWALVGTGWGPEASSARLTLAACSVLFLAYGGYLMAVRPRHGVVPCGCLGATVRTSRAAALHAFSLGALLRTFAWHPQPPAFLPMQRVAVLSLAVLAVAIVAVLAQLLALARTTSVAEE